VREIIPKHKQNASFMACGYALFSGKLGVCFSMQGPVRSTCCRACAWR
jgi:acetolactate synthase I/II/III large subunit